MVLQVSRTVYSCSRTAVMHHLKPGSKSHQRNLYTDTLHRIDMDIYFLRSTLFSDDIRFIFQEMASDTAETHGTWRVLASAVNMNINVWGGLVKIRTVWPFFIVETTRARDGHFDIFWYNGTVPVPWGIEFSAENLPAGRSVSRPSFEYVCSFVWNHWTTPFQIAGLGSTDQSRGFRVRRISHLRMSAD